MGKMEEEFIESILNSEPLGVVCDKCGSDRITEISYGLPWWLIVGEPVDPGISALVKEKRIVLGGCLRRKDSPKYYCRDCKNEFGKVDS